MPDAGIATGVSGAVGLLGAKQAASAQEDAANAQLGLARDQQAYDRQMMAPYRELGEQGVAGLKNFSLYQGVGESPLYDTEYTKRLKDYAIDPGAAAMKQLAAANLAKQEAARGLSYSTPGASASRQAELGMKYDTTGYDRYREELANRYKALQGEYAQKRDKRQGEYQQLLDMTKIGQGAAGTTGQLGQAQAAAQAAAMGGAGQANAGFWSGIGALPGSTVSQLGSLSTIGKNSGWFGGDSASFGANETYTPGSGMPPMANATEPYFGGGNG